MKNVKDFSSTPPKGNRALCVQTIGELRDGGQKRRGGLYRSQEQENHS